MAKITLPTLASGFLSVDRLNAALTAIAAALENTLSRDGTSPNQMTADLDMNGHSIINMAVPADDANAFITQEAMQEYVDSRASGLVVQRTQAFTASASQQTFTLTEFSYEPDTHNIGVYLDGARQFSPTDYLELSPTGIQFSSPLSGGEQVVVVQNDFLSTVELPTHTHSWGQINGAPVYTERWPTWDEITVGKPSVFPPDTHSHSAADITSGRLADARRGVYVQGSEPAGLGPGDAGALWLF